MTDGDMQPSGYIIHAAVNMVRAILDDEPDVATLHAHIISGWAVSLRLERLQASITAVKIYLGPDARVRMADFERTVNILFREIDRLDRVAARPRSLPPEPGSWHC
ncbi:hypothetical protein FHW69_003320 [Luteibacter sp. Sphag1AF]|uniref:hypothetical protein n=1 Tax=Luteibacter sp. Sphag1AF TaxID=2587031 RepID=UPI001612BB01|nr:hypothetical protein [Luteibacter sp. Sphag1AF]MBB3228678.1 hypothetical protein [Luteibacter sp. Sphag1AF]